MQLLHKERSRLVLIRHAPTEATRRSRFPLDEPVDERGLRAATEAARGLPTRVDRCLVGGSLRARQTAEMMGLSGETDDDLRECDFGGWAGMDLAEVHAADPEGLSLWLADPGANPHGGESLEVFAGRVKGAIDRIVMFPGTTVVVTHGGVVKVALLNALSAPLDAVWRVDVAPLSFTEFSCQSGGLTVVGMNRRRSR